MSNDVVLTAALRSNLLSLQQTQGLIDTTQFRLATGRKVNSALDNPQSFFAAQALNNRASDLTRLLDGIGQSIQVIKAADAGITALTRLVEQADSVVKQARDALAAGQAEAKVTANRDMRNINDLTSIPGVPAGGTGTLRFSATTEDGMAINLGGYGTGAATPTADVTITANMSTTELLAAINNLHLADDGGQALGDKAFEASLDDKGQIVIKTTKGGDFRLEFLANPATPNNNADNLALAGALGFGDVTRLVPDGSGNSNVEVSSLSDVTLTSFSLRNTATGEVAQASLGINQIVNSAGVALFANVDNAADAFRIGVNGAAMQNINLYEGGAPVSIQRFVDQINGNSSLNTKLKASYDDQTGELSIQPIDGSITSIEMGVVGDDDVMANFGFGLQNLTASATGQEMRETIRLAAASGTLASLEKDFNNLRDQITQLVSNGDTGYRGTNLLMGDKLLTVFNEFRTSSLSTEGQVFTAEGLGLEEANFSRISSTEKMIDDVRAALGKVRDFGGTLANDLSVIQTRQDYTKTLINTLTEGSDKLTVADQNEEGARMLALQTRQQLGVTSLSLASQSQQSILRLFG